MKPQKLDSNRLLQKIRLARPELEAIDGIWSFRPSYRFFPARLKLIFRNGESVEEVLKTSDNRQLLEFEKDVLEALRELGLLVPQVRSTVFELSQVEGARWGLLLQEIDGSPLDWLGLDDLHSADTSCRLVLAGIDRLHRLTDKDLQHPISSILPKKSLAEELELIKKGAGAWLSETFFHAALDLMERLIPLTAVPLVFSNGDYNPLNFISKNSEIVGWIDFEHACFEDPQIGFAKFLLWADDSFGWAAGSRAGLVERYVFNSNIRPSDFYCRVVLRGLYYIHFRTVMDPPLYMIEVVRAYTEKLDSLGVDRLG